MQGNQLLTESAPWSASTNTVTTVEVYTVILESLRVCGILLQPFIPSKAGQLLDALGVPDDQRSMAFAGLGQGSVGTITGGVRLFDVQTSKQ